MNFFFVVPTLNSSDNLSRLVSSLTSQSYSNWRLLFVDGGSNKYNLDKLKAYCKSNNKFSWKKQTKKIDGIYGAMNDGFNAAKEEEWLIFWGSDDWAFSNKSLDILDKKIRKLSKKLKPDLVICSGKYISKEERIVRSTKFYFFINYWISIFFGSSPPHQATIFGSGVRKVLKSFSTEYRLAADLDYFCKLSNFKNMKVQQLNLNFVKIGCGGISQRKTKLRFYEVLKIYKKRFSIFWIIPFTSRYIYRLLSLIKK
ncbi:MAG: glycosyl transferase [Cytophagia bacterium]|nr:glycosyl transferase [Cytophagia bacterium]